MHFKNLILYTKLFQLKPGRKAQPFMHFHLAMENVELLL
ncbi:hypothetical protein TKK_0001983 [Trichogramma kaykai]